MRRDDDFSAKTIRTLAARVGYHCSNPTCVRSTSGPGLDADRPVSIGVGAHIAAAAVGGKRYDPNMSRTERSSGTNGIWLCQSCSKLIDSDESRYTVALLYQWKNGAIERARNAISHGHPLGQEKPPATLDTADEDFLRGLNLPSVDAVDAVIAQLRAAAQTDIEAFRGTRGTARTIALTLRLEGTAAPNVTLESVGRLMALAEPVAVVAPGGTGKSTTLMQLAECMGAQGGPIPLLVPLGEWSDRQEDFFDFVLRRNAFGAFRRQHFIQLAYHGRLALLLDGWNELTPEARLRATNDLTALERDYPQLGVVISSRRQALPTNGPVVAIEALSEDQQIELAQGMRGEEGVELVDRAWRTTGVRELVGNPLYLNALLTLPSGAAFPETKEAVLRMFVQHNETAPDKRERLQRDTLCQHTLMLRGLAIEANRSANTIISDADANRTISTILRQLSEDGQIGAAPQPRAIVDGLVGAHLLVRSAGANGAVSFQPCDRLSRAGADGVNAVAVAVDETLGIDPLLAAKMLNRAADPVWQRLRDRVLRFVGRWHTPNVFDRAVRFMVTSGKPEFAELIWPLTSSTDNQIQFEMFRAADQFQPRVLGAEREVRLRALPAPQRKLALSEIASNSGFDGMELAATLAATDPDPEVVVSVVASLAFRRGHRHVNRIMKVAPDIVWKELVEQSYPDHLADAQLDARLATERRAAHSAETDPVRLLRRIADEKPADAEALITQLLGTAELESKDMDFEHAIAYVYPEYPSAVASGLVERIAANLPLPYHASDYLKEAPLLDTGPVAEAALDPSTPERRLAAAAVIGPLTVAALFEQLFAIDAEKEALARHDEQLWAAQTSLLSALSATRQDAFVPVLVANGQTGDPQRIGLLAGVLARHGGNNGDSRPPINDAHRAGLRVVVEGWMETLRTAPQPARHAASKVASAAGRLADAELAKPLHALLERDLADYSAARAARLAAHGRGEHDDLVYTRTYASAFAAMHEASAVVVLKRGLGDLHWGGDAAVALFEIWSAEHPPAEKRIFGSWTDCSYHLPRRAERAAGIQPTSEFAETIFVIVRSLCDAAKSYEEHRHALAIAVTGLSLPHGAKRREIDELLALPQPIAHKRQLLEAAARAGEIIPAALLMAGLRDLLAAAHTQSWRLEENRGELMGWIDLFPFSDNPESVHDAIILLPEFRRQPHELRRLLETVPQGPAGPALVVLERLAADNPAFLQDFEWMNAALRLDTEAATLAVLDHFCEGQIPGRDGIRIAGALTAWAHKSAKVRAAIIQRYRALPAGSIRRVLEIAMNHLTNEEVFMVLFDRHVYTPHPFHGVARALRNLAIGRQPSTEWAGAFEEFGRPLTGLRARLFAMLLANDKRARLAKQCLIAIEEHRDYNGRVVDEPRHPDIAIGRRWPPEAEEPPESPG